MGLDIFKNEFNECVLVNTTIGKPFGIVMDADLIDEFLEELNEDPMRMQEKDLKDKYYSFYERTKNCGGQ